MSLTLPLNAVSAATVNQTSPDDTAQETIVNTSTQTSTSNNSQETTTTDTNPINTANTDTNTTRYEGVPDSATTSTTSSTQYAAGSAMAAGSSTVIKVLIYSGTGASTNCVNGIKTALSKANANNLIPGVTFSYATSTKLTSTILSKYNLLVMPGGSGGSVYLNTISKSVIQNFVKNGGGYLGICAGAYSAAAHTTGYYDGWGIAPHVRCKAVSYEGKTTMSITSVGVSVLNRSGTITLAHFNGPAMYITSSTAKIFGKYADSKTGYKGYADIVGDYYGKGRTVLIGSHPELSPQYPDIIANLIAWATKTTSGTIPSDQVSINQMASAASSVKTYYETNKKLPTDVTINGNEISMPQFLYLLTTATNKINSGLFGTITIKSVNSPSSIEGTIKSGSITKSEYVSIAKNIIAYINSNGKAPSYATTSLGKMNFTKLVYMYSKIMNYYKSNGRLPNYVSMT